MLDHWGPKSEKNLFIPPKDTEQIEKRWKKERKNDLRNSNLFVPLLEVLSGHQDTASLTETPQLQPANADIFLFFFFFFIFFCGLFKSGLLRITSEFLAEFFS